MVGSEKVLFGSDWPAPRLVMSEAKWIDQLQKPPDKVKELGIRFSKREIKAILGMNASRIFKL